MFCDQLSAADLELQDEVFGQGTAGAVVARTHSYS